MPTKPAAAASRRGASLWAGMLVLYIVWGSTYLGIAVAVETIPPFLMAAIRFGIAGAVLLLWSLARDRGDFVAPTRREWRDSFIVGGLLLGGGMGMVAFGEQTIPSGITALLIALMPVWVAIFGRLFLGEGLPRLAIVGIAVGFVGVAILVGPSAFGGSGALDPLGLAAVLLSPICWSLGSLFASHRATLPRRPLLATSAQMLAGAAVLTVMAALGASSASSIPAAVSAESLAALAYLTVIGSLLAFTDVRLAAARRAVAADRDLRVRQSGRRGRPRRPRAAGAHRATDAARGRDHRLRRGAHRDDPEPDVVPEAGDRAGVSPIVASPASSA